MQKTITKDNLSHAIQEATIKLLELAREHSWNKISSNVKYVLQKIKADTIIDKNNLLKLDSEFIIEELISEFENIHLIELFILKASKKETIVLIEILEKSELAFEHQKTVEKDPPMLHCKVPIPPYIDTKRKNKFDINWQLGTLEYKWKMFWQRLRK